MGVTDEQAAAGGILQLADVLADGGLAQAQPATSLAEAAGLGYREKTLQEDGVEHEEWHRSS